MRKPRFRPFGAGGIFDSGPQLDGLGGGNRRGRAGRLWDALVFRGEIPKIELDRIRLRSVRHEKTARVFPCRFALLQQILTGFRRRAYGIGRHRQDAYGIPDNPALRPFAVIRGITSGTPAPRFAIMRRTPWRDWRRYRKTTDRYCTIRFVGLVSNRSTSLIRKPWPKYKTS